jgi:hypothetical protein
VFGYSSTKSIVVEFEVVFLAGSGKMYLFHFAPDCYFLSLFTIVKSQENIHRDRLSTLQTISSMPSDKSRINLPSASKR